MKLKQRPEDFSVTESWRFDDDPRGEWFVYLMDKQKLTTFEAVDRICRAVGVQPADVSYCGLKDKQGRTTQLVAVRAKRVDLQEADLRLKPLGRSREPLSSANTTSNRFAVTVRDLTEDDLSKLPASVAEVQRLGVVNYFDSQRFGPLKHGQGFLVKEHWGEWELRNPYPGAEKYAPVIRWLRKHPDDHLGAFLRTEPRWRALQVFTYQSWLWNEGVKRYLRDLLGITRLVAIRYQAGSLLFPRALESAEARALRGASFPLLGPDSKIEDPAIRTAALSVLGREQMALSDLRVPGTPQIHFDHEERPIFSYPGKLVVGEARDDEENRGRLKVNVAFTLPPGAYATLVVKRLFWWTLQPKPVERARKAEPKPRPTPAQIHEQRKKTGFLAKKRARKAAKAGK